MFIACISACLGGNAQPSGALQQPLDYATYMTQVWTQNIEYAARRLNLDVADAQVKAAQVFNNPAFSIEYADNDDRRMEMGRSIKAELSKTFTFGKRRAGIDLAQSSKALNEALLEDYFHRLRAEATLAYLEAAKLDALHAVREKSCRNIRQLAEADSLRLALGRITSMDAMQSRLEAEKAAGKLLQAEAEMLNACAALRVWTGVFDAQTLSRPSAKLRPAERLFDSEQLLRTALTSRADLAAALRQVDVARLELKVIQRERNTDVDIALGYSYSTEARNEIAPAPRFSGVTLGVTVPLKLSNANRGALQAAGFRRQQAELHYRQAELEVQSSVMQSLRRYVSLLEQVRQFEQGMLDHAASILEGKLYSYARGETSRLEALVAQQTYDELQSAYIETVYDSLAALIELERNAGIWDIELE